MPLQDSDNFIIGRGTDSYKITYEDLKDDLNYVPPPVLNLEVGKGSISPSVDLEEGDTLTGSATVTDAENPVVVHVWELDGVEVQRGSEATYVADAGSVRYRKEVTDDNNQSPKIGVWSDAVTVAEIIDDTVPNADMHGLRFDSARSTKLSRTGSGTGTISYWKKDSSTSWVWQHEHQTGAAYPAEIGAGYDGYMSDYYFVEGQDLPADTFVGQFDGKTGPLDSSDVYDNIEGGVQSPSDSCPNYAEKWSDGLAVSDGPLVDGHKGFDGNLTTAASGSGADISVNPATITFTPASPITVGKSLRIYVYDYESFQQNATTAYDYQRFGVNAPATTDFKGSSGSGQFRWVDTGFTGELTSLQLAYKKNVTNGGTADIYAIEVDGRILVDGPADNSQVWSDGGVGTPANGSFANVFDGSTSTFAGPKTDDADYVINFSGFDSITTLELYIVGANNNAAANYLKVNGSPVTADVSGDWQSVSASSLSSITFGRDGGAATDLYAVRVDGKILIDACPVWNTSQVWSDGQNVEARPEKASDGNTQTSYSSSADADNNSTVIGQGNEYALDNVGAVANKIEVLARGWLNSGKEELADIYVGANKLGTTPTQGSNTQAIWSSFDFTGTIDAANSLRIVDVSTGDYAQRLIAIRIDGEILVDGGSFGANGFHLPFDPAATGLKYSETIFTASAGVEYPFTKDKAFDGLLTTACFGLGTTPLEVSLPNANGKAVEVVFRSDTNGSYTYRVTGTNVTTTDYTGGNSYSWVTVPYTGDDASFIISSSRDGNSTQPTLAAVRVDGKILVDYNNIGVDASGQDNHFNDQNFALSATLDNADGGLPIRNTSDPYGKNEEAGFRQDDDAAFLELALPFNGTLDDVSADIKGSGTNKVSTSVPEDYEYTSDTKYYSQNIRNLPSKMIKYPAVALEGANWTIEFWVKYDEIGDHPDKNNLVIFGSSNVAGNPYVGVETDGRILIGWYTGTDRFNYYGSVGGVTEANKWYHLAFVKHGTNLYGYINGNRDLYATNVNNFTLTSGEIAIGTNPGDITRGQTKTWCDLRLYVGLAKYTSGFTIVEFNQSQDTVLDTPMNNYAVLETGKNGNLVATGTGQILGTVKGNNWYCEITPTAGTSNSDGNNVMHIQVFDQGDSEVLVWRSDTGDTYTVGDVVGIAIKDNSYQWYKNGSPVNEVGSGSTVPGQGSITGTSFTAAFLNGGAANAEAAYNFGQQPFAYDPPAGYEGLYQTWEQWAHTALGYAVDRIAQLEQRNTQLEALVEEARTRLAALELNEISDDAVDTALITLIGNINDRLTALEATN